MAKAIRIDNMIEVCEKAHKEGAQLVDPIWNPDDNALPHIIGYWVKPWGGEEEKEGGEKPYQLALDSFSASAVTAVYKGLNPTNQAKLAAMELTGAVDLCFSLLNKTDRRSA